MAWKCNCAGDTAWPGLALFAHVHAMHDIGRRAMHDIGRHGRYRPAEIYAAEKINREEELPLDAARTVSKADTDVAVTTGREEHPRRAAQCSSFSSRESYRGYRLLVKGFGGRPPAKGPRSGEKPPAKVL